MRWCDIQIKHDELKKQLNEYQDDELENIINTLYIEGYNIVNKINPTKSCGCNPPYKKHCKQNRKRKLENDLRH
ncbi:MAG TPA: hypothetical protein VEP90_08380 [Methylomirabilota bacterium]|nr:hypothetical protein [Methylomirabilota bacterium]